MEEIKLESKDKKPLKVILVLMFLVLSALLVFFYFLGKDNEPAESTTAPIAKPALAEPKVQLALFATGLTDPTGIVSTKQPGDKRLFILDRAGLIRIIDSGKVLPEPFLDIRSIVLAQGEMGLLGLAFSPKYAQDGFFFINYIDKNRNTIIARYHVSTDAAKADPASGQSLLTLKQPYDNHNGGDLLFGKDGYLYAALGDGGAGGDPENRAQKLDNLFGKILRLDVSAVPYKIPPDNPFVNQAGKKAEIWGYGLRNPWRVSFDKSTYDLYIADVGQGTFEEVSVQPAASKGGENYGWRCFEGNRDYNPPGGCAGGREQYVFPAFEYDHNENRCSITGGYVYRGSKYPALNGKYFYGDFCSGQLFWAEKKENKWQQTLATTSPYQISAFGEDVNGELYLADFKTGSIYLIQDSGS